MIQLCNIFAYQWWDWMGAMFWQASLLIFVVGGIDLLVRRWIWPQVRYALWLMIFVKLLIPPDGYLPTAIVPRLFGETREQLGQLWDRQFAQPAALQTTESVSAGPTAIPQQGTDTVQAHEIASTPDRLLPQVYLCAIWLAGMSLLLAYLILKVTKLRRWRRQQREGKAIPPWFSELLAEASRRVDLGRQPAVALSHDIGMPAVYGVFRPVLLLPERYLNDLSQKEVEHILLHELCHVKRGDLWIHALVLLLQVVYWFNPFLWWANRQFTQVREMCCDQTLAALLKEETDTYRETLLKASRELAAEKAELGMEMLCILEIPFWPILRIDWLGKQAWSHSRSIAAATILVILSMAILVIPMARRSGSMHPPMDSAAPIPAEASSANR